MITMRQVVASILLAIAVTASVGAAAGERDDDPLVVNSEAFQRGHPDMRWRNLGATRYQQKRYREAVRHFRDAARYGDKPSQAMLALMLWNGDGVEADRVQAYAWIDLAAERGYGSFVATRERFRTALSEDERRRAMELRNELYAKYGDEHAKKRLNLEMTREKLKLTGSHLGRPKGVLMLLPGPDGRVRAITDSVFWNPRYWSPQQYWALQDRIWEPSKGRVDVGPVQPVDAEPAAAEKR
ncbi:tetratricopeptide repeat protein [Dokdonella ginsengisoli]|uniref:Tetratricopeptide repeat protein n=1 Tax=Dokdonella ginsengisoli TaxID=363846 RepID=A0ABV9QQ20_9GAMM